MSVLKSILDHTAISSTVERIDLPSHWIITPAPDRHNDSQEAWRVMVMIGAERVGMILVAGIPFGHVEGVMGLIALNEAKHGN